MGFLGMLLIVIGWFLQYRSRSQTFERNFLLLYASGTILLIFDNLTNATLLIALFNLIVVVLVGLMIMQGGSSGRNRRRR